MKPLKLGVVFTSVNQVSGSAFKMMHLKLILCNGKFIILMHQPSVNQVKRLIDLSSLHQN